MKRRIARFACASRRWFDVFSDGRCGYRHGPLPLGDPALRDCKRDCSGKGRLRGLGGYQVQGRGAAPGSPQRA
jgi:hypothetical protein